MTTFQAPLKTVGVNGLTGNAQTQTAGFVHSTKPVSLGVGQTRQIITLPPKSTPTNLRGFVTSAPSADVSAFNISWGNSSDATRYGIVAVSALGAVRAAAVSGAGDFEAGGTIVIVCSAVSTTTFTTGGVRAFVEYLVTE